MDSDSDNDSIDQLELFRKSNVKPGMFVSGWEDPNDEIVEDTEPHSTLERKILWAANEGNIDIVQTILDEKPSCVHAKDEDGYTPLHRACYNNNTELVKLLIRYGADVNALTDFKWTPLHSSCQWKNNKCIALLLQYGADVNARTDGDQTPLHIAASVSNCREMAMTIMLNPNVQPNLLNNSKETAADIARRTVHLVQVDVKLEYNHHQSLEVTRTELFLELATKNILVCWTKPSCTRNANKQAYYAFRQSKTMKSLLEGKKKSKRFWSLDSETPKLPSIASITNPTSQGKSSIRRVNVLNKLFMQYITDFMATNETWSGYGLEISRVKITTDFHIINVYWLAKGDGSDAELESKLSKAAGPLRHNLSQLRLMGEVPTIKFVKDKIYAKVAEVETLLKHADFGDDFVPTSPSQMVKNDFSCNEHDDVIPVMTHDVLGLNQAEIMSRIRQNMCKARQAWEKHETKIPDKLAEKLVGSEERNAAIIRLKEEEFQAFITQRRKRKYREGKIRSSTDSDAEYEDDDFNRFEEGDFIDDEFESDR